MYIDHVDSLLPPPNSPYVLYSFLLTSCPRFFVVTNNTLNQISAIKIHTGGQPLVHNQLISGHNPQRRVSLPSQQLSAPNNSSNGSRALSGAPLLFILQA